VYRLNPQVYPSTLCLVPTDLDQGGELNRMYIDADLVLLLLRPQMNLENNNLSSSSSPFKASASPLNPITKASSGSTPLKQNKNLAMLDLATLHDASILDDKGKMVGKFFEKKMSISRRQSLAVLKLPPSATGSMSSIQETAEEEAATTTPTPPSEGMTTDTSAETATVTASTAVPTAEPTAAPAPEKVVELVIALRGIQVQDEPTAVSGASSPQARAAVPKVRTRGTTYNSFQNLQKDMEKSLEQARRHSKTVEKQSKTLNMQLSIMEQFRSMQKRATPKNGDSLPKQRWKKACRRIIMDMAVERTREMLVRKARNTLS